MRRRGATWNLLLIRGAIGLVTGVATARVMKVSRTLERYLGKGMRAVAFSGTLCQWFDERSRAS
jgi:hypothetical protein